MTEGSRTGGCYTGFFYVSELDAPLHEVDITTGFLTNIVVMSSEQHSSTEVDLATGDIDIGPYKPTAMALRG